MTQRLSFGQSEVALVKERGRSDSAKFTLWVAIWLGFRSLRTFLAFPIAMKYVSEGSHGGALIASIFPRVLVKVVTVLLDSRSFFVVEQREETSFYILSKAQFDTRTEQQPKIRRTLVQIRILVGLVTHLRNFGSAIRDDPRRCRRRMSNIAGCLVDHACWQHTASEERD